MPSCEQWVGVACNFEIAIFGCLQCKNSTLFSYFILQRDNETEVTISAIVQELVNNVEGICSCGLQSSQIINSVLQCYDDLMALTFRAVILGNAQRKSQALLNIIQQWVEAGDHDNILNVTGTAVTVNSDCKVPIQSYDEESCDVLTLPSSTTLPPASSSSSTLINLPSTPPSPNSTPPSPASPPPSPTSTPPTPPKQAGDDSNSAAIAVPVVIIILLILIGVAVTVIVVLMVIKKKKQEKNQEYLMFGQDNGGEGEVHPARDTYQPMEGRDFNNPIYDTAEESLDTKISQEPSEVGKGVATGNIYSA